MSEVITNISNGIINPFVNLLGGFDFLINTLFMIIVLDAVTRLSYCLYKRQFLFKNFITWIVKNIGVLVIIMISVIFDNILTKEEVIRDIIIYNFLVNKIYGIITNWKNMGLKIPEVINTTVDKIKTYNIKK